MRQGDARPLGDEPPRDCSRCPRLAAFRSDNRDAQPAWHNGPVPSFGSPGARLLVVGLAPGLKGANRTGRPFTGDFAGDLLYATLQAHGFVRGTYAADASDGLALVDARITNVVRCVPPQNKPTPAEIKSCVGHLAATIAGMPALAAVLALGRIAHDGVLAALALRKAAHPFAHGRRHTLPGGLVLHDSYHCSRYNTSTGVLTPAMFDAVVTDIRRDLD